MNDYQMVKMGEYEEKIATLTERVRELEGLLKALLDINKQMSDLEARIKIYDPQFSLWILDASEMDEIEADTITKLDNEFDQLLLKLNTALSSEKEDSSLSDTLRQDLATEDKTQEHLGKDALKISANTTRGKVINHGYHQSCQTTKAIFDKKQEEVCECGSCEGDWYIGKNNIERCSICEKKIKE